MVIRSNKPPYGELFAIEAAVIPPDIKITRTERYEYHTNGLFFLSFLNENPARNTANIVKGDVIPANIRWITLEDVGLSLRSGGKIIPLPRGNLLFTHFGVSGPVILDMSHEIVEIMDKYGDVKLYIDFKPDVTDQDLEARFIEDFGRYSKRSLKNYLKYYLPQNMVGPVLKTFSLDPDKKLNQITRAERIQLQRMVIALPVTINGHLPLDKAMITCGGVSKKEINPRTMESKLVPGLYFAGEIIDGCGRRGGFNLQQAFSTGYVAGDSALALKS